MSKIVVLAINGLDYNLVNKWAEHLPNLKELQENGNYGKFINAVSPTNAMIWGAIQTGQNPGCFGFWDDSYRDNFNYRLDKHVRSDSFIINTLYDIAPKNGKVLALINMPYTSPTPVVHGGYCISNLVKEKLEKGSFYPTYIKKEIKREFGEYIFDNSFQDDYSLFKKNKKELIKNITKADDIKIEVIYYFIKKKSCDCIFAVINGISRLCNLFYQCFDKDHIKYEPDSEYKDTIRNHYLYIDGKIGEILHSISKDTNFLIFSPYRMQKLDGRINLNEFLIDNKYLILKDYPDKPGNLDLNNINWKKTKAWSVGNEGQIYFNVKDREKDGVVKWGQYDNMVLELSSKLGSIVDDNGKSLNVKVIRRDDVFYGQQEKLGPDIFVVFNNSFWKTNPLIGYGLSRIYSYDLLGIHTYSTPGNDGYFCLIGPSIKSRGIINNALLEQVTATIIDIMGLCVPYEMEKTLNKIFEKDREIFLEEEVLSRLKGIGY